MGSSTQRRPAQGVGWLLVGVASAGVLFAGARGLTRGPAPRAAQAAAAARVEAAGLEAPLEILRDAAGIPHVRAASERDAYFGLGFVHAEDRPGQLLRMRRAAWGRVAEVEGRAALARDREARVLGFGVLAEREADRAAPRVRALLEAYSAGVNAGLARWRARGAPPGLATWGEGEPPFGPADALAIAKLDAWALGGTLEESLVLSDLVERFGGFEAAFFFPNRSGVRALPAPADAPHEAERAPAPAARRVSLRRWLGRAGASIGSAAFVVGGRESASGRPLVAGDAHYEPTVPGALYLAHLSGGPLQAAGAGPPGVPVFWWGFNRKVAWAAAYAGAVTADLYVETLSARGAPRYHDGESWRPLDARREEIRVRGGAPEALVVHATRHGPLLGPLLEPTRPPLALRWPGAEPGSSVEAFSAVALAGDAAALRDALELHPEPVLAVAYADAAGAAGIQTAGFLPERGLPAGLLPVPARDPDYEWRGRLPRARLPARILSDGAGFAIAADGAPASADPAIEWLWRPGERSARLGALLAEARRAAPLDVRALVALGRDVESARAGAVIERALAHVGEGPLAPAEREVQALLRSWDRRSTATSPGAAAYHVFQERLLRELLEPHLGEALLGRYLALGRVRSADLVLALLASAEEGASPFAAREVVADAVRRSLRSAWLSLSAALGTNREKWTWGRLHPLRFRPLLVPADAGPGLGPFPYAGDAGSVQVAEHLPLASFDVTAVASHRLAVDAAALDEALVAFAPGQAEHPGHPHRADVLERWLAGQPALLATSRLVVEELSAERLELVPAP